MSQDQVLRLLEKAKKPLSIREIKDKLKLGSAGRNIAILVKHNEVKWVWIVKELNTYNNKFTRLRPIRHYFV